MSGIGPDRRTLLRAGADKVSINSAAGKNPEFVREAARQMLYADVHRLFVTDSERAVGVISSTDIVRAVANGQLRS